MALVRSERARGDAAGAPHLPSQQKVCEPCQFCQTFCSWAADVMCSASMRSGCSLGLRPSSLEDEMVARPALSAKDGYVGLFFPLN